eukprot:gene10190-7138_t
MLICVAGIYVCFGLWSIKQERVFTKPYAAADGDGLEMYRGLWPGAFFQTSVASAVAVAALGAGRLFGRAETVGAGRGASGLLSASNAGRLGVMGFTNAFGTSLGCVAMRLLPFPVVLAAKMGKMIPVMLVGYLWYGTRYELQRVAACLSLSAGVYLFYVLDASKRAHGGGAHLGDVGLVLLLLNLLMDGVTNATQDIMVKRSRCTGPALMAVTNASTTLWLGVAMAAMENPLTLRLAGGTPAAEWLPLRDWGNTVDFLRRHPDCAWDLAVLSLVNGVGQLFIFWTISLFGTLTMTAMTLVRKAGSVGLSLVVHGHSVRPAQGCALALTLASAAWDAKMSVDRAAKKMREAEAARLGRERHQKAPATKGKDTSEAKRRGNAARGPTRGKRRPKGDPAGCHQSLASSPLWRSYPDERTYNTIRYGTVRYGMVWYGTVWYGMVRYGMVWYGTVWYGMVWCYLLLLCQTFIRRPGCRCLTAPSLHPSFPFFFLFSFVIETLRSGNGPPRTPHPAPRTAMASFAAKMQALTQRREAQREIAPAYVRCPLNAAHHIPAAAIVSHIEQVHMADALSLADDAMYGACTALRREHFLDEELYRFDSDDDLSSSAPSICSADDPSSDPAPGPSRKRGRSAAAERERDHEGGTAAGVLGASPPPVLPAVLSGPRRYVLPCPESFADGAVLSPPTRPVRNAMTEELRRRSVVLHARGAGAGSAASAVPTLRHAMADLLTDQAHGGPLVEMLVLEPRVVVVFRDEASRSAALRRLVSTGGRPVLRLLSFEQQQQQQLYRNSVIRYTSTLLLLLTSPPDTMRAGDVDAEDLLALLSELNAVGGRLEDGDESRPSPGLPRRNSKPPGVAMEDGAGPVIQRGGFSTYTSVGVSDADQGHRAYVPPLNVRLAPLGDANGKPPPRLGALNPLPALSGRPLEIPKDLPTLADFGVPQAKPPPQDIPAAPGKRRPVPPQEQQGLVARRPAPPPPAPHAPDEERETNFLPIMCARYLQPAGLTPPPRWGHTLTAVTGCRLLLFGGMEVHAGGKSSSSLMLFSTNDISWEPVLLFKGETPAPRHSHAACAYEGRHLIIFGGMSATDSGVAYGDVHLFDVSAQEWRCLWRPGREGNRKNEPGLRYGHTMVLRHHRLYVFGGRVKKTQGSAGFALANNDIYVFSLSSGRWKRRIRAGGKIEAGEKDPDPGLSPAPPPGKKGSAAPQETSPQRRAEAAAAGPTPRAFHAACVKGSLMYIHGGSGADNGVFNDTWCVDLSAAATQWCCLHPGTTADAYGRERHAMFACGEGLLLVGGCSSNKGFNERVAGKFNSFTAVLPVSGKLEPPPNPYWIPVAMGNVSIVAPNKRSFAAAFSGGFVYVFGGQSGSDPATNAMIRFLAADGYTTTDARGTAEGNDEALRNLLLQLRETQSLPFDAYAMATTFGAVAGSHDRRAMTGLHRTILQFRAPRFWEQLAACRSEPLRTGMGGAPSRTAGDALDALLQGSGGGPQRQPSPAAPPPPGAADAGALVYYTSGNKRVEGLPHAVVADDLEALATYLYSGALPPAYHVVLEDEEEVEDDAAGTAPTEEKERMRRSLHTLQDLAVAYDMAPLKQLCDAFSSGQRRMVEKALAGSTAALRADLVELLRCRRGATVTVLFVDPHTKEQMTHSLHPAVLMGASPFFADLLRPLYHGQKTQCQVGPVAAKITCSGPLLASNSKRAVLVGPVSIPKLAVQPILSFLYSQELKAPKEVAYVTMLGAHQLDLPLLQGYCEAIVAREEVNYESCCSFYYLARKYEAFLLEEMSLLTAVAGYSTVRFTVGYKSLSEEDRNHIDDVANELGSSSWVPPPAPTTEMKPPDTYAERWKRSAA